MKLSVPVAFLLNNGQNDERSPSLRSHDIRRGRLGKLTTKLNQGSKAGKNNSSERFQNPFRTLIFAAPISSFEISAAVENKESRPWRDWETK
jgi:hypothetical protein